MRQSEWYRRGFQPLSLFKRQRLFYWVENFVSVYGSGRSGRIRHLLRQEKTPAEAEINTAKEKRE